MNEQQKKAVEEKAKEEAKFNHRCVDEVHYRLGFINGADEVINNPSKYGLRPINEGEEG